jgi:hypothetical protein
MSKSTSAPRIEPIPGAGTLAVLALAWLLAMISSARQAVGGDSGADPFAITRAALEYPQVVSACLVAGVAGGLAAGNLFLRLAPSAAARPAPRYPVAAGAGVAIGLVVAIPTLLGYPQLPTILMVSGSVATAAGFGGLLSGVRHRSVVAAGVAGALGGFLVGLVARGLDSSLRRLFGAGDSAASVVTATGWVALTGSLTAGAVAGGLGYAYLRRAGPAGLRWPAYLVAGALPGLLVLLAEAVARLGGARLFQAVSALSADDRAVLSYLAAARLNRALIVVFLGALVAVLLLGRTLRPAAGEPVDPAGQPAQAGDSS